MPNCIKFPLAVSVLLILCAPVSAAEIFVEGGLLGCGQWTAARSAQDSQLYETFAVGLLGGMAMGHDKEFWHANGDALSRDAALSRIDDYCRAQSSGTVVDAAVALFRERTGARVLHSEACADSHLGEGAAQSCIKRDAPRP